MFKKEKGSCARAARASARKDDEVKRLEANLPTAFFS